MCATSSLRFVRCERLSNQHSGRLACSLTDPRACVLSHRPARARSRAGSIFSYAVSYDWSRGSEHYNPRTNHLLLHAVPETEIKSRNSTKAQAKGFGR